MHQTVVGDERKCLKVEMFSQIDRFLEPQRTAYPRALEEIRNGRKETHWMWYIFPQLRGLGQSDMAQYYGIDGINEAKAYGNPTETIIGNRTIRVLPLAHPRQIGALGAHSEKWHQAHRRWELVQHTTVTG